MISLLKRHLTLSVVLLLVVSAFCIRVENFKSSQKWTIDEMVYYHLGNNLKYDISNYNSRQYAEILKQEQPNLGIPEYLTKPIFKHPPVFPLSISVSMRIFGDHLTSAIFVSAAFGSLLILLGFLLGKSIFDEMTGLMSACFLWVDPVSTICSQKIWMDTTLAFFTVLSILLFSYALKKNDDNFFIWAGLATGFAFLTKYPGILVLPIMFIYAAIFCPHILKKRKFQFGMMLPFILSIPWLAWNISVSGLEVFITHFSVHTVPLGGKRSIAIIVLLICVFAGILLKVIKKQNPEDEQKYEDVRVSQLRIPKMVKVLLTVLFCAVFFKNMGDSLSFFSSPRTSWQGGHFNYPLFYFSQLIEFSFFYFFGFMAFIFTDEEKTDLSSLLYLSVIVLGLFYLNWGNYQLRYILSLLPFLIVLGMYTLKMLYVFVSQHSKLRTWGKAALLILTVWIFIKTSYVNYLVSYPNDMSYF